MKRHLSFVATLGICFLILILYKPAFWALVQIRPEFGRPARIAKRPRVYAVFLVYRSMIGPPICNGSRKRGLGIMDHHWVYEGWAHPKSPVQKSTS